MKSIILITILGTLSFQGVSQSKLNNDSLVREICNTVKNEILQTDSLTILNGFKKHLSQYINQTDEKSWQILVENCYFRLQRECPEFKDLLDKVDSQKSKGDWKKVSIEPDSKVSAQDCIDFFRISNFKYLEDNGDTVRVIITDSAWTDYFLDGTFSKLSLAKVNNNDFTITFIESNNLLRKNFSRAGDKYRYKILLKFDTYYEMFTEIIGSAQMQTFRLHY